MVDARTSTVAGTCMRHTFLAIAMKKKSNGISMVWHAHTHRHLDMLALAHKIISKTNKKMNRQSGAAHKWFECILRMLNERLFFK